MPDQAEKTHLTSCFAWTASWPHEVPTTAPRADDPADVTCRVCLHALGSQKHAPPRYVSIPSEPPSGSTSV